jgi:hypothetical protein
MRAFHVLALLLVTATLAAQCPYERVKTVPPSFTTGPGVECDSGVDVTVVGIQLKSRAKVCPLFIVITPTHDVAEPSSTPTRVVQYGELPEYTAFFKCVTSYFLFFAVGSDCEYAGLEVTGYLPRLRTEVCPEYTRVDD